MHREDRGEIVYEKTAYLGRKLVHFTTVAVSVSAKGGFLLWFSLAQGVPHAQAQAFLQALRRKYLSDLPASKKLGARWDPARKIWYVNGDMDLAPFARWSPTPHDGEAAEPAAKRPAAARKDQSAGHRIVGAKYVERPVACACPPWEDCDKCRTAA